MSFKVQFSHIAEIIMGQSPKGEEVNNEGIGLPLLNGPTEFTDRYPLPVQHTAFEKKTSLPGDILFCVRGSTTGKMNYSDQKYCIGRGLAAIRGRNGYPTPYVKAVLEACLPELLAAATGSTFPNVSRDLISNISVDVLSVDDAYRISKFIESQEGKVFNNNRINQTLEQMAQALFKSWFVDFEPVKAKIAVLEAGGSLEDATLAAMTVISGKDADSLAIFEREYPEKYAELKATAELFPTAMQESELGEIPVSWTLSEIGKEINIAGGATPSTKTPEFWDNGNINWTTPKDLSDLKDRILLHTERKITKLGLGKISSGLLPINTVLMSSRAPVGYLAIAKIPVAINQGYIAMKCDKDLSPEFVLQWCSINMPEIVSRASGTTFAEISKKNFKPIPLVKPPENLVKDYTKQVSTIYSLIENNARENNNLSQLRDTLLPKLLSGEITLPEAEEIAKEADYV
ncbi:TPA: restriction endonuclease subunit S [Escherichia coli]|uniref:restriction endonuclease subunit S n=2 Tax=Enterobacterales TaxID=91347 RepID=UPI000B510780|nr:restriction endonuclease subunit S [Escherichia coli]MBW0976360.1 restriction endonuclease subunit S [Shigella sonnei]EFA4916294.1 restriction endonuclease subunit S [Escherichia coli]EFB5214422.1 restriction endonuclease subunit S [Escherichia coli]EFC1378122.1 restriction endonuclease subunit S [Escherichia coli]EFD1737245.1 restriction endonuclease subunit S [Escherichia coli]